MFGSEKTIKQRAIDLKIYLMRQGWERVELDSEKRGVVCSFDSENIMIGLSDDVEIATLMWGFYVSASKRVALELCNDLNLKNYNGIIFSYSQDEEDDKFSFSATKTIYYPEKLLYRHIAMKLEVFCESIIEIDADIPEFIDIQIRKQQIAAQLEALEESSTKWKEAFARKKNTDNV